MRVLKPYDKLFNKNNHKIILKSGRDAGKSTALYQIATHHLFAYNLDIIMCRANSSDIEKSLFNGLKKYIEAEGYTQFCEFKTRSPGYRIHNKLNGNTIYFEGIGGHDLERTKGLETHNKVSLIIVDEAQQLPRKENLDQAWDTFRRHFDKDNWTYLIAFNPKRQNSNWLNEEYRLLENEDDWLCLHTSYLNISKVLTDIDLKEIRREKQINPTNYRYRYLGETDGLYGGVYHTFNRDIHLIKPKTLQKMIQAEGIFGMLIGVDSAKTRDKTALVPTLILNNGQGIVVDYFYHDPEKNGALSNDMLYPYLERWLDYLHKKYNIAWNKRIDIIFDTDANSADLRILMNSRLRNNYVCTAYSGKNVIQMAHIMQNAFGKNMLYVLDEGGIFNWYTNNFEYGFHPLVTQLESVIWDEKGRGFDDTVPNDVTDALTYSIGYYFKNVEALYYPEIKDYYERGEKDE